VKRGSKRKEGKRPGKTEREGLKRVRRERRGRGQDVVIRGGG